MKILFRALLCALLAAALFTVAAPAAETETAAPHVVLSDQPLNLGSHSADCDMYNIEGYNYFKLRDVAALLSSTASRFSVAYDAGTDTILVTTGEAYAPIGGELIRGTDNAASAKPSRQSIIIDGEAVTDLSVYNIGGYNYFKLRDLSDHLGFSVTYDEASRTIVLE